MGAGHFHIYKSVNDEDHYLAKIIVYLVDRPGSLSSLASNFSSYGINITFFHYNRSEHPNRVLLEVAASDESSLVKARKDLSGQGLFAEERPVEELSMVDTRNLLKMEILLEHRPGALGEFASLLANHEANVIHMDYNEALSENSANISIITQDPAEVDNLLKDINEKGYHYGIIYRGVGQKEIDDVIGLNLVERFFFRLKGLLATDDIDRLKDLVDSSKKLTGTLLRFSSEAGKNLEEGKVYTNVLAFASASLSRTGTAFSYTPLPMVSFEGVALKAFRLPTGGNIMVLQGDSESVMIDGTYGIYYEDVKKMLAENDVEPSSIGRIYLSHADADHAGTSGYFQEEFGSRVSLHRDSQGILENEDRSFGSGAPVSDLNRYFTSLVNDLTKMKAPREWTAYSDEAIDTTGYFRVIDGFTVSGQKFAVMESLGGHVPGQVFFLSEESGLLFTGDYLLLVDSLSPEEKEFLNLPRFMMTSTNVDSALFRKEMVMLKNFAISMEEKLRSTGRSLTIVPGHGDHYPCSRLMV